jgi:hypothetical protein
MYSLHLVTVADVVDLVSTEGSTLSSPNQLTARIARNLADRYPSFVFEDISLTAWEAQVERGIGMMLRPLSRLLVEAGLDRAQARSIPVRLDLHGEPMGGSWIPASLITQAEDLIESRLERQLARLREAEIDPVATVGTLLLAFAAAREAGAGLLEANRVMVPGAEPRGPLLIANRKSLPADLRKRLEEAAKPPKQPGLVARLVGRRANVRPDWPPSKLDGVDPD